MKQKETLKEQKNKERNTWNFGIDLRVKIKEFLFLWLRIMETQIFHHAKI